jgi:hypothetical protein
MFFFFFSSELLQVVKWHPHGFGKWELIGLGLLIGEVQ